MLWRYDTFRDKVHAASGRVCRNKLGNYGVLGLLPYEFGKQVILPEADVNEAIIDPISQAHTAAAGPPRVSGVP